MVALAAAAGMADRWRWVCWFFCHVSCDIGGLGIAVARLVVEYLVAEGTRVMVAFGGTFFAWWGKKVAQARRACNGAAQGGQEDRVR